MRLIGLSGKAGSGKGEVASIIATELPHAICESFANGVREEAYKLHAWDGQKDATGRSLLQAVGQRRRAENPRYWIDACFERMSSCDGPGVVFVIDDVRYGNEATAIQAAGGALWRVDRPGHDNGLTPEQQAHESEVALDTYPYFDAWIDNVGGLDELRSKVQYHLTKLPFPV